MNIREALLQEHSKKQTQVIANYIGSDKIRFKELMGLFLKDTRIITQRAGWVISECCDKYPYLIQPHLEPFILNLQKEGIHDAVKRNTVRILDNQIIPENLCGPLADSCFRFLEGNEPIAIKAFSMTIIANMLNRYPELANELKVILEDQLPYASPGFRGRAMKVLKQISSLS